MTRVTSLINFLSVNDCDMTVQHCRYIQVTNADYATCNGVYELQSTTKLQRPVYYSETAVGIHRYISYSHHYGKWYISYTIDTVGGGYHRSAITPACHPADAEAFPWSGTSSLVCLWTRNVAMKVCSVFTYWLLSLLERESGQYVTLLSYCIIRHQSSLGLLGSFACN